MRCPAYWRSPASCSPAGALDFAGGTVVHINAAVAGLVGSYVIGKRVGYGREAIKPHNLTQTMVGASILWVGWFGFNAGSALEANAVAAQAFVNTFLATAAAVLGWTRGGVDQQGQAVDAGCGIGCGRRSGRDHAGRGLRRAVRRAGHRRDRRRGVPVGRQRAQAPAGRGRRARRVRRARRRRHPRRAADRRVRLARRWAARASGTTSPKPRCPNTASPRRCGSSCRACW